MKTKIIIFVAVLFSTLALLFIASTVIRNIAKNREHSASKTEKSAKAEPKETIVFDKDLHDFGTIEESKGKVSTVFTFTNRSKSPLIISRVAVSCGCSAADWTKEPVAPGKKGYVKVTYDPTNRVYFFNKILTVISNATPSNKTLTITGTVVN